MDTSNLNFRRLLLAGVAVAGAMACAQGASAEEGALEEIVVTARKREENLQQTPLSITAVSGETLEKRNVVSIEKISDIAPAVSTIKIAGSLGAAANFIRSIGHADVVFGQDAPVGVYIDGVYNGRNNNSLMDLVALERVEVLRGPQGTLFGRNTTGGAISIVTRTPSDEFGGEVKGTYGSYNTLGLRARIDTGLIGNTGIKLTAAYQHRQADGYIDNKLTPDDRDPNAYDNNSFWGKAVGSWGGLTATLTGDYVQMRGVPPFFQFTYASNDVKTFLGLSPSLGGDAYTITPTSLESAPSLAVSDHLQRQRTRGLSLTLDYEVNDALSFKSITAQREYDYDGPFLNGPNRLAGRLGFTLGSSVLTISKGLYTAPYRITHQQQFSQELQVLGSLGEDIQYVAGAYYWAEQARGDNITSLLIVRPGGQFAIPQTTRTVDSVSNESWAGFGQVSWRPSALDHKLELTGGLRYTKDDKKAVQLIPIARTGRLKSDNLSVVASVNYQWTDDVMTYARYATGYRAGGFNTRAALGGSFVYIPEEVETYEAGFKAELLDRRLRLNGAAYYTDYTDLQVGQFQAVGGSTASNAKAHIQGFELEALAAPTDSLTLTASVGYSDAKYDVYFLPAPVATATPGVFTSGPLANFASVAKFGYAPKVTANAGFNYEFAPTSYGQWSIRADYSWKSRRYFMATDLPNLTPYGAEISGKPYGLLSAKLTLSDIPLGDRANAELSIYGENLADESYVVSGVDFGPGVGFAAQVFGQPRTFGVDLKVKF